MNDDSDCQICYRQNIVKPQLKDCGQRKIAILCYQFKGDNVKEDLSVLVNILLKGPKVTICIVRKMALKVW